MRAILTSLLLLLTLSACNKREIEDRNTDFGYDYFPLRVGQFWDYEVDSILIRPDILGIRRDTFPSFLREIVADTFVDNTGTVNYRVDQYTRRQTDQPWQVSKVLTLSRNDLQAFRVEDNLRFQKLAFPVRSDRNWPGTNYFDELTEVTVGGNVLEMFKGWESTIVRTDASWATGDLAFDEVAEVQIADFETFIELRLGTEYYARNVGLIYRSLLIFDTQCQICCNGDCGDLGWEDKVEQGFQLDQRLIRHN